MRLRLANPVQLRIEDLGSTDLVELAAELSYPDRAAEYAISRLRGNKRWKVQELGQAEYDRQLHELQERTVLSLLFRDDLGLWTMPGLAGRLAERFGAELADKPLADERGEARKRRTRLPDLRGYQQDALDAISSLRHCAVEVATGLGKTRLFQERICATRARSVVMVPTLSIAWNVYHGLADLLGKGCVGRFFDGNHESTRDVTVAVAASLARVSRASAHWERLSSVDFLFVDESHLTPAASLARVCSGDHVEGRWEPGLFARVPHRKFFSGTQTRADGKDLLLEGLIGPIVYRKDLRQGVAEGWLAQPSFVMCVLPANGSYSVRDTSKMSRHHLLLNPRVHAAAAKYARTALAGGQSVLTLVDEVSQMPALLKALGPEADSVAFAYGSETEATTGADEKGDKLPERFRQPNVDALVEDFNAGRLRHLVGTGCIGIGTDIKPPTNMLVNYVMGGQSKPQVQQAVGRGARGNKERFTFVDFDVHTVPQVHQQALARAAVYEEIFAAPRYVLVQ